MARGEIADSKIPSISPMYNRIRFLWKHNHKRFSEWEAKFVLSIGPQLRRNIPLTEKQEKAAKKLLKKFKVSPLDTASIEAASLSKMTLEEFVSGPMRNSYIWYKNLHSYFKKGIVGVNGKVYRNALIRANTTNKNGKRALNITVDPKKKSTGQYRELDELSYQMAKKYGFDGVYVEQVLNDFLGEKLIQYGYVEVKPQGEYDGNISSYWKPVT